MMRRGEARCGKRADKLGGGGVLSCAASWPCQWEATEGCFSQHIANDVRGPGAVSPDGRRLESEGEREI